MEEEAICRRCDKPFQTVRYAVGVPDYCPPCVVVLNNEEARWRLCRRCGRAWFSWEAVCHGQVGTPVEVVDR